MKIFSIVYCVLVWSAPEVKAWYLQGYNDTYSLHAGKKYFLVISLEIRVKLYNFQELFIIFNRYNVSDM